MDVRVRFFGGFDGNPRRAVVLAVDTTEADYAHVLLPAVQFNVRLLKSRHFIRIIGKLPFHFNFMVRESYFWLLLTKFL